MTLKFVFFSALVNRVLPRMYKLCLDLFYAKIKFGHLDFLYVKIIIIVIIIIFKGNYCVLMSQSWLKHSTKLANEVK